MINYEKIKQENKMLKQQQSNKKEDKDENEDKDIIIQEINTEDINSKNEKIDIDVDKLKNILFDGS